MSKWSSAFRDSRWQKLRLEVMERDEWTCQSCGAKGEGITLNVHHAYYESGKAPWEYPKNCLVTWCDTCHENRHLQARGIALAVMRFDVDQMKNLHRAIALAGWRQFFEYDVSEISETAAMMSIEALGTQSRVSKEDAREDTP